MEATTLEDAVASITGESTEGATGEDNLRDAVEEIVEAPDEDQTETVDETEEGEDEVDTSDLDDEVEDEDAEIDDEDHVEDEVADTNLFTVKVDGKDENWTMEQLKQSAAGQAAISKRFQENAQARKTIEREASNLAQQQAQVLQLFQQAQQNGFQEPQAPSRELFESDPIGYMEKKMKYDDALGEYNQRLQGVQQIQQQNQQQQAQAYNMYLQEQSEILKHHIPSIADPEKGAKLKTDLMNLGVEYGFSAEEMGAVSDARYVRALNDARKYRQIVDKRAAAEKKGAKARPVVKAGTAKRPDSNAKAKRTAQNRLKNTGSIDDALSLILNQ